MIQGCPNELANVVVRERIEDVLAFAAALHRTLDMQDAKLLRERRELGLARVRQLGHTALPGVEPMQQTQTSEIARRSKERRRAFERDIADFGEMGTP
jgi:hypothetical protein